MLCESSMWVLKWLRTMTRTVKQIIPVRMVNRCRELGQQIMCASKGLVVYRDGLEVSREKGRILAPFQTVVGGLWVMEAPSAATTGGVPGKGCFVPGFIKLEGDEPGLPGQVEKSLNIPYGDIANDLYYGFQRYMEGSHVSEEVRN